MKTYTIKTEKNNRIYYINVKAFTEKQAIKKAFAKFA